MQPPSSRYGRYQHQKRRDNAHWDECVTVLGDEGNGDEGIDEGRSEGEGTIQMWDTFGTDL